MIPTTKFGVDFFYILFIFLLGINIFYLNVYAFIWYVRFLLAKKKKNFKVKDIVSSVI